MEIKMRQSNRTPSSPQRSGHRSRRGTILIFVVGVLVLLALAATAYLTTARVDRATTKQNEFNTQVDLLLEGVKRAVVGVVTDDESARTAFRNTKLGVVDGDGNLIRGSVFADRPGIDRWLADRVPSLLAPSLPLSLSGTTTPIPMSSGATNPPLWRFISQGIFEGQFEEPSTGRQIPYTFQLGSTGYYQNAWPAEKSGKPALYMPQVTPTGINWNLYEAADADGDGIADSGFVRLPIGPVNGVTYYAAIRVVDHNSQINATTAMSRDTDYTGESSAATPLPTYGLYAAPVGLFGTSVGIEELLLGGTAEADQLRAHKLGGAVGSLSEVVQYPPGEPPPSGTPWAPKKYRSIGDLLHHGLNRRIDRPETIGGVKLQGFSLADTISLAYRGGVVRDATATDSRLEKVLPTSLKGGVSVTPYKPTQVATWFNNLYNYDSATPNTRRPLITSYNPTTPVAPSIDLTDLATLYPSVFSNGSTPRVAEYIELLPKNTTTGTPTTLAQRCSINTATFKELWRAFLNVMLHPTNRVTPEDASVFSQAPGSVPGRTASTFNVTNRDQVMMLIRSAQAAVNAIDLRDDDEDISVRQIRIPGATAGTEYIINVFGTERQPFITRSVFFDNGTEGQRHDYGAIELYNPYDTPLDVNGYKLVVVDRGATSTATVLYTIGEGGTGMLDPIPPRGFMVLQSQSTVPAEISSKVTIQPEDRTSRGGVIHVNDVPLSAIRDQIIRPGPKELFLMRPRRAGFPVVESGPLDLTPIEGEDHTNEPDERSTAPNAAANLVPLDMVLINDPGNANPRIYVRGRPTAADNNFKCVYERVVPDPTVADPLNGWTEIDPAGTAPAITLGAPNDIAPDDFPTIQISPDNAPYPYPVYMGPNDFGYPYGGFGRLGDLLHVPFIGGTSIFDQNGDLVEINAISYDAFAADDRSPGMTNDIEAVGKFDVVHYKWAADLFEYFTVINHPEDEYEIPLPRSDGVSAVSRTGFNFEKVPGPGTAPNYNKVTQAGRPQGLININTAPMKVLASLPWMRSDIDRIAWDPVTARFVPGTNNTLTSPDDPRNDNLDIAKAIIAYRDSEIPGNDIDENGDGEIVGNGVDDNGNGQIDEIPTFHTIADVLKIPAIAELPTTLFAANEPGDLDGDLTPVDPWEDPRPDQLDNARTDLEERALLLTRVSNLITTRSDTFTAYILLQGYRNAGTANAELVVQRRAALIIDRSKVTPEVSDVDTVRVFTD